jgi:protein gp37
MNMGNSKIPWLKNPDGSPGKTWPLAEGCTKVSAGCLNCCAERVFNRWHPGVDFSQLRFKPGHLEDPFYWKKPQRILVDFMYDLFHPNMPDKFIAKVFAICKLAYWHTFLILTKRPARMNDLLSCSAFWYEVTQWVNYFAENGPEVPEMFNNVWIGVSVEDQKTADERIPLLLKTPASKRFVSFEPALGPLDLFWAAGPVFHKAPNFSWQYKKGIDWVICGSESGPGARPMEIDWARSVKEQCQVAGVPFFFKQMQIDGILTHMPELDGKVWDQFPEMEK